MQVEAAQSKKGESTARSLAVKRGFGLGCLTQSAGLVIAHSFEQVRQWHELKRAFPISSVCLFRCRGSALVDVVSAFCSCGPIQSNRRCSDFEGQQVQGKMLSRILRLPGCLCQERPVQAVAVSLLK